MTETKKILLIGRIGSGKSTLSNVLSNTSDFEEGASLFPVTKEIQTKDFYLETNIEKKYKVIDTVGFGDPNLTGEEIASKILEACQELENGLNQVFFVIGSRITQEEIRIFNIIKKNILGERVSKYTTVVRTNFPSFQNENMCDEERNRIKKENGQLSKLINSCNGVIYADNPSLDTDSYSLERIEENIKRRKVSRDFLIDHLEEKCQDVYISSNLESISNDIASIVGKEIDEGTKKLTFKEKMKKFGKKINNLFHVHNKEELYKAAIEVNECCKQM